MEHDCNIHRSVAALGSTLSPWCCWGFPCLSGSPDSCFSLAASSHVCALACEMEASSMTPACDDKRCLSWVTVSCCEVAAGEQIRDEVRSGAGSGFCPRDSDREIISPWRLDADRLDEESPCRVRSLLLRSPTFQPERPMGDLGGLASAHLDRLGLLGWVLLLPLQLASSLLLSHPSPASDLDRQHSQKSRDSYLEAFSD